MDTLTTTEAVAHLAQRGITVTRWTVRDWCQRHLIFGAYRVGVGNRSTWHIPVAALDAALEAGVIPPRKTGRPRHADPSPAALVRRKYHR